MAPMATTTSVAFFRLEDFSLPYFECRVRSAKVLKVFIDTGSNKNYIQPNLVSNAILNIKPFIAATPGGDIKITQESRPY